MFEHSKLSVIGFCLDCVFTITIISVESVKLHNGINCWSIRSQNPVDSTENTQGFVFLNASCMLANPFVITNKM